LDEVALDAALAGIFGDAAAGASDCAKAPDNGARINSHASKARAARFRLDWDSMEFPGKAACRAAVFE
jgi:hypothetical protein